jgi:hypothetical protein
MSAVRMNSPGRVNPNMAKSLIRARSGSLPDSVAGRRVACPNARAALPPTIRIAKLRNTSRSRLSLSISERVCLK